MRILFASLAPFDASHHGGAQQSTRDLARALAARGVACAVLGRLHREEGLPLEVADVDGFDQLCVADPAAFMPLLCERFRPDVAVLSGGDVRPLLDICTARSLPALVYFRDVEFGAVNWLMPVRPLVRYLANSAFVARAARAGLGLRCETLPSLVQRQRYAVASTRERVLFVNPLPKKGVHIALALARALPRIPFTFVEGWAAPPAEREPLARACAEAGNIELAPPTVDMRAHYRRARVVLVPSVWEESSARVVAEAQISGIPVLASGRGGLPESVGPGGIVEDPFAPVERWAAHLAGLWNEPGRYAGLAEAARQHASRPEIAEETITRRLLASAATLLAAKPRLPSTAARTPLIGIAADGESRRRGQPKVFGIGLGRTGTSTLTEALRVLGCSAIHYPLTLAQIHAHDAATDSPVAANFEVLDGLFPGSRFVRTVRPVEDWLASCARHYSRLARVSPQLAGVRYAIFGRADYDRAAFLRGHAEHEARVRRYFAARPGDLLEIDLSAPGDHWTTLCEFLGRPRPAAPFPWLNRSTRTEALAVRLCDLVGGAAAAVRLFNLSPPWVDAVLARREALSGALDDGVGDDGIEFANLLDQAAARLGGAANAAAQLRLPEAVVAAAIERMRESRRQHGMAP